MITSAATREETIVEVEARDDLRQQRQQRALHDDDADESWQPECGRRRDSSASLTLCLRPRGRGLHPGDPIISWRPNEGSCDKAPVGGARPHDRTCRKLSRISAAAGRARITPQRTADGAADGEREQRRRRGE